MIALVRRGDSRDGRFPDIDLSGIQFPSDTITIRALREAHPEQFDIGFAGGGGYEQPKFFFNGSDGATAEDTLGAMLYCERLIATDAYAAAKGVAGMGVSIDDFKEELAELYTRYGISKGPHHAAELIRGIEQQGAALASQKQP